MWQEHLRTHVAQYTPDAVVPGVLFVGIAYHILRDLAEFFQQFAIRVDVLIGGRVHEATVASDVVALRDVGMRAGDQFGHIRAKLARLW